ncbi:hypothetical protein Ddye_010331 [Dipteronia dyeriana]|uniref:DUF659 domain-containing protein n=1 Tax=Dipteronia dyeriana TaxID=168575 RepID=A0AAE0CN80_9ROSI|nr:hypothetical protein Ddye_010331 [Dipteronia dyeriana]
MRVKLSSLILKPEGVRVHLPSAHEIRHKYLDIEYKEMKEYVDNFKNKWNKYDFTIMCDGWTGLTRLSIINFMVCCKSHTIFLKSVIKDHQYIYGLLKDVVKEFSEKNVVQIVTDNGSAFVKAIDWWVIFGNCAPSLCAIAVRILSQTSSSSACERNCSSDDQRTFDGNSGGKYDGDGGDEARGWDSGAGGWNAGATSWDVRAVRLGCWCNRLGMLMQVILIKIVVGNKEEQVKLMKII